MHNAARHAQSEADADRAKIREHVALLERDTSGETKVKREQDDERQKNFELMQLFDQEKIGSDRGGKKADYYV